MNLQEALANISGVTARLEALTLAANTASEQLTISQARVVELEGLLAAAPKPEAITELQGQIAALTTRAETAEKALSDEQEAFPVKLNAEVARVIAANGHEVVSTVTTQKQEEPNKPGAGLTGLAKSTAILQSKMPQPARPSQN